MEPTKNTEARSESVRRRDFVRGAAAGAGLLVLRPESVFGTQANSAIRLGVIGCGGRGNGVAAEFVRTADARVTAVADLFDDRLAATQQRFDKMAEERGHPKLEPSQIFKGARAYQRLVECDLDAVLIASPPFFHPEHFEAAVAAGKHVYLEKPVATDVRGCKRVIKAGKQAQGKITVHVGFQTRFAPPFRELVRRIDAGAIGEIACVQAYYYTGDLPRKAKPEMPPLEARIRNWVFDRVLSGDILVEQNVHVIDVCNWVLRAHPLRAAGTGGRKVRTDVGDVWDHYVMTFYYPNGVHVSFNSTQFTKGWSDISERFFGSKGTAETHYRGGNRIVGDDPWDSGVDNTLERALSEKVRAFAESVRTGRFDNETDQGAEATLSAILGRTAAYAGKEVTWEKLTKSDAKWDEKLNLDML